VTGEEGACHVGGTARWYSIKESVRRDPKPREGSMECVWRSSLHGFHSSITFFLFKYLSL